MHNVLIGNLTKVRSLYWRLLIASNLFFSETLYAWFPTTLVKAEVDNKDAMSIFVSFLKKGFTILLFIVSLLTFFKFISTVTHGIEEAKKNEGGMMAVFASYAVMAMIYLTICMVCAYLGFNVVSQFQL